METASNSSQKYEKIQHEWGWVEKYKPIGKVCALWDAHFISSSLLSKVYLGLSSMDQSPPPLVL